MGANTAGIYGAQLYRADDEPRYRRAFSICIAVLSLGATIAIVRKIDEIRTRRRNKHLVEPGAAEKAEPDPEPEIYAELNPASHAAAGPQTTLRL